MLLRLHAPANVFGLLKVGKTGLAVRSGIFFGAIGLVSHRNHSLTYCEVYTKPKLPRYFTASSQHVKVVKEKRENKYQILYELILKDWKFYVIATIASILSSLCTSAQAKGFGKLFDLIGGDMSRILPITKELISLFSMAAVFSGVSNFCLALASNNFGSNLRLKFFEHVINLDISFFDRMKSSEVVYFLSNDISALQSSLRVTFSRGIESVTSLLSGFAYLYITSPEIATSFIVFLPIATLFANSLGSFLKSLSKEINIQSAKSASLANESISMIKTVRSFNNEHIEINKYEESVAALGILKKQMAMFTGGFYICLNMGLNFVGLGICAFGAYLVNEGKISKGDIAGIVTQVQMLERSMMSLSRVTSQLSKSIKAADSVFDILCLEPIVNNARLGTNYTRVPVSGRATWSGFNNSADFAICFDNVDFTYPIRPDVKVLKGLSLDIKSGETIAFVGPSGGGKSTTLALLQRFYLSSKGAVKIQGVDVKQIPNGELYRKISTVSQEPDLFSASIRDNIAYGKPDATDEEIIEAARKANALSFIEQFPETFNTGLGERGALLSGGQKQRIAIARAILADSDILLLDEATSALDNESEHLVHEALSALMKNDKKTTIIIAHRLSTILKADRIAVVEDGCVVEEGRHQDLLEKKNGQYSKLFNAQFKDQETR